MTTKKIAFTIGSHVALAVLVGILCFYWGTQTVSEYWAQQYLRQRAFEAWAFANAKSAMMKGASPNDLQWLDHEINDAKLLLSRKEFAERVRNDQDIQRSLKRLSEVEGRTDGGQATH